MQTSGSNECTERNRKISMDATFLKLLDWPSKFVQISELDGIPLFFFFGISAGTLLGRRLRDSLTNFMIQTDLLNFTFVVLILVENVRHKGLYAY